ncbi:hypothetical protein VTI74DRAFT_1543 [Chaetomium olivicolor]
MKRDEPTTAVTEGPLVAGLIEKPARIICPLVFDSDDEVDYENNDHDTTASPEPSFCRGRPTHPSSVSSNGTFEIKQPKSLLTIGLKCSREREGCIPRQTERPRLFPRLSLEKQASDKQPTDPKNPTRGFGAQDQGQLFAELVAEEVASSQRSASKQYHSHPSTPTQSTDSRLCGSERNYEADDPLIAQLITGLHVKSKNNPPKLALLSRVKQAVASLSSIAIKWPARIEFPKRPPSEATSDPRPNKSIANTIDNDNDIPRSIPILIPAPKPKTLRDNHVPLDQDDPSLHTCWLNDLHQLKNACPLCSGRLAFILGDGSSLINETAKQGPSGQGYH